VATVQSLQEDLMRKVQTLAWVLRKAGPYVALEILLPGGTLLALLLFLYRRRHAAPDGRLLALKASALRMVDDLRVRMEPLRAVARIRASV
jgi:hypothetical protein